MEIQNTYNTQNYVDKGKIWAIYRLIIKLQSSMKIDQWKRIESRNKSTYI